MFSDKKRNERDLKHALEWAAAEYKYIAQLRDEIHKINMERNITQEIKDLHKSLSILKYIVRAQRRAVRFEIRVGKKLQKYRKILIKELGEGLASHHTLLDRMDKTIKSLQIEQDTLIKYASMYKGYLRQGLTKAEAELQLEEEIETEYPKKAKKINSSLKRQLEDIEKQVGIAKNWVIALESTLKEALKLVDDIDDTTEGGLAILKKNLFPIAKYPKITMFLAQRPDDLRKIVEATGAYSCRIFEDGLPLAKELIRSETWPGIVKMAVEARGVAAFYLFRDGLPEVKDLITPKMWPLFVEGLPKMSKHAGGDAWRMFRSFLHAFKDLISPEMWPLLVDGLPKMAKSTKENERYMLKFGLPVIKDLITPKMLPLFLDGLVKMANDAEHNAEIMFKHGLPVVKDLTTPEMWPLFVDGLPKIVNALSRDLALKFFQIRLPQIRYLITIEYFPGVIKLVEKSQEDTEKLFWYALPSLKDLITPEMWPLFVNSLPKMMESAEEGAQGLFNYAIPAVKELITFETWSIIVKKLLKITDYCKGKERMTYESLQNFKPLFNRFGIELFDLLIFPTLKRQSVASYFCFYDFGRFEKAILTKEDIKILITILNKRKFKAHDFFYNVLGPGINQNIIAIPLTREKEYLLPFIENSPVDLLEIYVEFKKIITSDHPEKDIHLDTLFKDLRRIKKEIYEGITTKEYDPKLLLSVLYSVFSPELTVSRDRFQQVYGGRADRQADIPSALHSLQEKTVSISLGGYSLREGETLNDEGWRNLVEVVSKVNKLGHKTIVSEILGLDLLESFLTKRLKNTRKEYLLQVYAFSKQQGEGLPEFNSDHTTLMKYKEFVGDRLRNDIITLLLDAAYTKQRIKFAQLINRFTKPKKMDGLAKQLFGLWKSNHSDKEVRIRAILERNNILIENIDWHVEKWQDIRDWLKEHAAGTVSKDMINDIFVMLMGEDYNKMQREMDKFEHSHKATGRGGQKLIFMLSKRKLHSVAMFNMGVCVAPDDRLWNMPDFWQMIIWNEFKEHAYGGVIFRTIEEQGKKYLILSIQPNGVILNEVSPVHLYDQIIQYAQEMRKKLKYNQVLIPVRSGIHSNRGSIQAIILKREYQTKILLKKYHFSYTPVYNYQEFFIVE